MALINGSSFARTTSLMRSDALLFQLQNTNRDLQERLNEITTGRKINHASDEPSKVSSLQFLRQRLIERGQEEENLQHATSVLNLADQSLGEASEILREAHSLALSQIGVGSDAATRKTESYVVDAQLQGLIDLANREFNGVGVFAGNSGAMADGPLFEEFLGGIRYRGTTDNLRLDVGAMGDEPFNSNGLEAFGALSTRVESRVDLDPQASAGVRLSEINGAQSEGFRSGTVRLSIDGTVVDVDLSDADTLGDVETRINDAITNTDPTAGNIALTGAGYQLTANAGHTITIADVGSGKTAGDLGLDVTATAATVAGGDLNVKLTDRTRLADLGVAIDFASGLHITQGEQTKVADFSAAQTVQDLRNAIDALNLGLRYDINEDQTALNLVSEVSGIELSIGENGGTTATDLGVRSLDATTRLDDFRKGNGVEINQDEPDFAITLHDGTSFEVDLAGAQTVADVIAAIDAAAGSAGLTPGVEYSAGLALTGNGIRIEDNTAGPNDFAVTQLNNSLAATHLGVYENVGAANSLVGQDNSTVEADNLFTHMQVLRDSLRVNDESGISLAGDRLETDLDEVVQARSIVGVQAARLEDQRTVNEDRKLTEETMLSNLRDADLTETITRFQQLQQQLQASLQAGSQSQQLSLLDFLS